eukprot:2060614-Pyramimonas_sp.AAC.1
MVPSVVRYSSPRQIFSAPQPPSSRFFSPLTASGPKYVLMPSSAVAPLWAALAPMSRSTSTWSSIRNELRKGAVSSHRASARR